VFSLLFGVECRLLARCVASGQQRRYHRPLDDGGMGADPPYGLSVDLPGVVNGDEVGCSLAMQGGHLFIGACGAVAAGAVAAGAVYRVQVDRGSTPQLMVAPDSSVDAYFGSAIATSDAGFALIGAPGKWFGLERAHGAAYLFDGVASFTRRFVPLPQDRREGMHFGSSVALFAGRALVGARGPNTYSRDAYNGNVFVFDVSSGAQLRILSPLSEATGLSAQGCYWFGATIAVTEDLIVVGAPRARYPCSPGGAHGGAAFVFEHMGNYTQRGKLLPPSPQAGDRFASAVAIRRDESTRLSTLLISAPGALSRGVVHSLGPLSSADLANGSWASPEVGPAGFGSNSRFGHAVALEPASGLAVVTSPHAFSAVGADTGAASLLRRWMGPTSSDGGGASGVQERVLWGAAADAANLFGSSVAVNGAGVIAIGATRHKNPNGSETGLVYVFYPLHSPTPPPPASPPHMPPPTPPSVPSPSLEPPAATDVVLLVAAGAAIVTSALACVLLLALYAVQRRGRVHASRVLPMRKQRESLESGQWTHGRVAPPDAAFTDAPAPAPAAPSPAAQERDAHVVNAADVLSRYNNGRLNESLHSAAGALRPQPLSDQLRLAARPSSARSHVSRSPAAIAGRRSEARDLSTLMHCSTTSPSVLSKRPYSASPCTGGDVCAIQQRGSAAATIDAALPNWRDDPVAARAVAALALESALPQWRASDAGEREEEDVAPLKTWSHRTSLFQGTSASPALPPQATTRQRQRPQSARPAMPMTCSISALEESLGGGANASWEKWQRRRLEKQRLAMGRGSPNAAELTSQLPKDGQPHGEQSVVAQRKPRPATAPPTRRVPAPATHVEALP
jgi:hypothetical protein